MFALQDLQKHLDSATQGAIYFSLGSNIKSKYLPNNVKTILLDTFSELPYKVLWKYEDDLPEKPDNVIVSEWFPQQHIFSKQVQCPYSLYIYTLF